MDTSTITLAVIAVVILIALVVSGLAGIVSRVTVRRFLATSA